MIHMDCGVLIWAQKLASLAINPGISESRIRQSNRSIAARLHLVEELAFQALHHLRLASPRRL
jgi:hypothetical protein